MGVLERLRPEAVFNFFEAVSGIPRGSGDEKKLSDYIFDFAKQKNLYVHRDGMNNVIIKKPGTAGYEGSPPVMLQGHLDMVCEKNAGTPHDFLTDPIRLRVEGDYIKADGTTLGADDGIAVAYMLALLDSSAAAHPPIEAVFTTNEEIGLEGAAAVDARLLLSKRMINLDCGAEGVFTVSCAGGVKISAAFKKEFEAAPDDRVFIRFDISGLAGGHSGTDIHRGRANANVLIGRLLYSVINKFDARLADIGGGMKDNAVPRESYAVVAALEGDVTALTAEAARFESIFKGEYNGTDPGLKILTARAERGGKMFSKELARGIVSAIMALPNGVLAMDAAISGLVETSNNLGVIRAEGDKIVLVNAVRSSVASRKEFTAARITAAAESCGAETSVESDYPSWAYRPDSEIRKICAETYREMYGREPSARGVHAGLECGVFGGKMPGLDMIALGPDMMNIHTPDEALCVSSAARVWEFLLEVLRRLK